MLFFICWITEHTFWNRLAIPFHSLFPIPQVSLKVSSKVTLFMNFSNWNALLRIVSLLLCDLVWKAACTKLKRALWIKAERLGAEIYNEHKSTWGPVLLPQKWAARVWFWFCWSSYKSRGTSLKHTWVKSEQAVRSATKFPTYHALYFVQNIVPAWLFLHGHPGTKWWGYIQSVS